MSEGGNWTKRTKKHKHQKRKKLEVRIELNEISGLNSSSKIKATAFSSNLTTMY